MFSFSSLGIGRGLGSGLGLGLGRGRALHNLNPLLKRLRYASPSSPALDLRVTFQTCRSPILTCLPRLTLGTSATATIAVLNLSSSAAIVQIDEQQQQQAPQEEELISGTQPPTPPEEISRSILNLQKLSFGSISGICVGIFIRKGLKLLACLCGAGFIFLQFLHSRSMVDIDWIKIERAYDGDVRQRTKSNGVTTTTTTLVHRFWSFLTADFQSRSSFAIGILLGFRIG